MMLHTILCAFGFLYAVTHCASAQEYNPLLFPCPIFDCPNGAECDADSVVATCLCEDSFFGASCEAADGTADCSLCDAEGTAIDPGNSDAKVCGAGGTCICKPGYTGAQCETRMADVQCDADTLTVTITTYPDAFSGRIYLATAVDADFTTITDSGCTVDFEGDSSGSYSFPIPLDGEAPDAANTAACRPEEGDTNTYSVHAYIQYDSLLVQEGDSVYTFTCSLGSAAGPNEINVDVVSVQNREEEPDESTFESEDGSFSMTVTGGDGLDDVPQPIRVGADLSLVIQHTSLFSLKSCTGYNYDPTTLAEGDAVPDGGVDLALITEWCDTTEARAILRDVVVYADGNADGAAAEAQGGEVGNHVLRVPFNAWYFVGASKDVWIQCIGCVDVDGECDYTAARDTCANPRMAQMFAALPGARRRRRAAEDEETTDDNIGTLAIRLTIDGEQYQAAGDATSNKSDKATTTDCYSRISVILPMILLAALLLVAMVMTFFFCMKVTRAYERSGEVNMAYKS